MKIDLLVEWYDGELQQVMEDGGRYFYAICVAADFSETALDRVYFVFNLLPRERRTIGGLLAASDVEGLDHLLREKLYGRLGARTDGAFDQVNPCHTG